MNRSSLLLSLALHNKSKSSNNVSTKSSRVHKKSILEKENKIDHPYHVFPNSISNEIPEHDYDKSISIIAQQPNDEGLHMNVDINEVYIDDDISRNKLLNIDNKDDTNSYHGTHHPDDNSEEGDIPDVNNSHIFEMDLEDIDDNISYISGTDSENCGYDNITYLSNENSEERDISDADLSHISETDLEDSDANMPYISDTDSENSGIHHTNTDVNRIVINKTQSNYNFEDDNQDNTIRSEMHTDITEENNNNNNMDNITQQLQNEGLNHGIINTNEIQLNCIPISNNNVDDDIDTLSNVSNTENEHTDVEASNLTRKKRKRSTRHNVNSDDWNRNKHQKMRMTGQQYIGTSGNEKKARVMRHRCECTKISDSRKCILFSEEDRKTIFDKFWKMSWNEKKIYISMLTTKVETGRHRDRIDDNTSRRTCTFIYRLPLQDEKMQVCKLMFTSTLDMDGKTINRWKISNSNGKPANIQKNPVKENIKTRQRESVERKNFLAHFFDSLPKMESHYCRKNTTRLYIEPLWRSKKHLYESYCTICSESAPPMIPYSQTIFDQQFSDRKLSIFAPRKDRCDICVGFEMKTVEKNVYDSHIEKKNLAENEKKSDKKNFKFVYTMDLQSVLLAPKSLASSMYYKTKLIVHNFTLFNLSERKGYCHFWDETNGGVSANDFSTMIYEFIRTKVMCEENIDEIILWSDGCCAQNRNVILANTLCFISKVYNIRIIQKYLTKGHTMMEVDTMHAQIERIVRDIAIHVPQDYVNLVSTQLKKFDVNHIDHSFFKNFSVINKYKNIRPGTNLVTDIVALKYEEDTISYKLNFNDEWKELPMTCKHRKLKGVSNTIQSFDEIPPLYTDKIPISKTKFMHLQQLKSVIPPEHHKFYDNIKYKN